MSGSCLQVGAMHITPGYTHPSKDPQFDVSHTRLPSNLLFCTCLMNSATL